MTATSSAPLEDGSARGHCLAVSWQRRWQSWLSNARVDVEPLVGSLIQWALHNWRESGKALHRALDTTMVWNRYGVVVVSIVMHGRAIPLVWRTFKHPGASISAEISISMLQKGGLRFRRGPWGGEVSENNRQVGSSTAGVDALRGTELCMSSWWKKSGAEPRPSHNVPCPDLRHQWQASGLVACRTEQR